MAKEPNLKPQTPGEDITPDDAVLESAAATEAEPEADLTSKGDGSLEALQGELSAAKAEILRLMAELKQAGVNVKTEGEIKESKLPTSASVDPKKIKARVLTKDGWVLPE